eukprot:PhM_4_TR19106/c0_g1_i1/m.28035
MGNEYDRRESAVSSYSLGRGSDGGATGVSFASTKSNQNVFDDSEIPKHSNTSGHDDDPRYLRHKTRLYYLDDSVESGFLSYCQESDHMLSARIWLVSLLFAVLIILGFYKGKDLDAVDWEHVGLVVYTIYVCGTYYALRLKQFVPHRERLLISVAHVSTFMYVYFLQKSDPPRGCLVSLWGFTTAVCFISQIRFVWTMWIPLAIVFWNVLLAATLRKGEYWPVRGYAELYWYPFLYFPVCVHFYIERLMRMSFQVTDTVAREVRILQASAPLLSQLVMKTIPPVIRPRTRSSRNNNMMDDDDAYKRTTAFWRQFDDCLCIVVDVYGLQSIWMTATNTTWLLDDFAPTFESLCKQHGVVSLGIMGNGVFVGLMPRDEYVEYTQMPNHHHHPNVPTTPYDSPQAEKAARCARAVIFALELSRVDIQSMLSFSRAGGVSDEIRLGVRAGVHVGTAMLTHVGARTLSIVAGGDGLEFASDLMKACTAGQVRISYGVMQNIQDLGHVQVGDTTASLGALSGRLVVGFHPSADLFPVGYDSEDEDDIANASAFDQKKFLKRVAGTVEREIGDDDAMSLSGVSTMTTGRKPRLYTFRKYLLTFHDSGVEKEYSLAFWTPQSKSELTRLHMVFTIAFLYASFSVLMTTCRNFHGKLAFRTLLVATIIQIIVYRWWYAQTRSFIPKIVLYVAFFLASFSVCTMKACGPDDVGLLVTVTEEEAIKYNFSNMVPLISLVCFLSPQFHLDVPLIHTILVLFFVFMPSYWAFMILRTFIFEWDDILIFEPLLAPCFFLVLVVWFVGMRMRQAFAAKKLVHDEHHTTDRQDRVVRTALNSLLPDFVVRQLVKQSYDTAGRAALRRRSAVNVHANLVRAAETNARMDELSNSEDSAYDEDDALNQPDAGDVLSEPGNPPDLLHEIVKGVSWEGTSAAVLTVAFIARSKKSAHGINSADTYIDPVRVLPLLVTVERVLISHGFDKMSGMIDYNFTSCLGVEKIMSGSRAALAAVQCAWDVLTAVKKNEFVTACIGIDVGSCCGALIGGRLSFEIFGPTRGCAERLAVDGAADTVSISPRVFDRVDPDRDMPRGSNIRAVRDEDQLTEYYVLSLK